MQSGTVPRIASGLRDQSIFMACHPAGRRYATLKMASGNFLCALLGVGKSLLTPGFIDGHCDGIGQVEAAIIGLHRQPDPLLGRESVA